MSKFRHYPFHPDFHYDSTQTYHQIVGPKPDGLWLSYEDHWIKWCQENNFYTLQYRSEESYKIVFKHDAMIAGINSPEDIFAITEKYMGNSFSSYWIDWVTFSKNFQGIIISPLQWSCRLHNDSLWYYGWDVASGCIWDLLAIESVEKIGT